jgi:hypothetical protein
VVVTVSGEIHKKLICKTLVVYPAICSSIKMVRGYSLVIEILLSLLNGIDIVKPKYLMVSYMAKHKRVKWTN